ncbi:unnamed protein product, partial [Polarella glacialis]
ACRAALKNESQRDFFVQIATGGGKSLIMADLLSELDEGQRACIIVPKLDLMEQIAQLLESLGLPGGVSRVGTGHVPDLEARVFVCVRNSAWRLADLNFDMLILDEAHHYEPGLATATSDKELSDDGPDPGSDATDATLGPHASTVLGLHAKKRIFFSATLRGHQPDFDFGLREAVRAAVITDYTILVPFITVGDPKPSLVELVRNLPTARRILAFCNTVHEAQHFAQLLNSAGVPAGHYNGGTARSKRAGILELFEKGPARGGIRVLVTVDVLSEGVDLPMADTCMFVEPRRGLRLRQCVGRVLRRHLQKVDALVISPPIVQKAGGDLEADTELIRLLSELASADEELQNSLVQDSFGRIGIVDQRGNLQYDTPDIAREEAARLLTTSVYPRALSGNHSATILWELGFAALKQYVFEHGNCRVPASYLNTAGFSLGRWVKEQRLERRSGNLLAFQIEQLDKIVFIWSSAGWQEGYRQLASYKQYHGHTTVPTKYVADDGFKLGHWVKNRRSSKKGKPGSAPLDDVKAEALEKLGFTWGRHHDSQDWEQSLQHLQAYKAKHNDTLVPYSHVAADGFNLGSWVSKQRLAKRGVGSASLDQRQMDLLDQLGFVWEPVSLQWERRFQQLQVYTAEHGDTFVPSSHVCADGFHLGTWVSKQRSAKRGVGSGSLDPRQTNQRSAKRRGTGTGSLDQQQMDMLDKLGFVWERVSFQWEQHFQRLQAYKAEHGDTLVPNSHVAADGFHLGAWVANQRSAKRGVGSASLDQRQMDMLDELGFVWEPASVQWEQHFQRVQAYTAEHGNTLVPSSHVTADGFHLGAWVSKQRSAKRGVGSGSLDPRQKDMLDKLGFVWEPASFWEQSFQRLQAYKAEHGSTLVPRNHVAADGFNLGTWVSKQRSAKRGVGSASLDQRQMDLLDQLGFVWEPVSLQWERRFQQLQVYTAEHGDTLVPSHHVAADGFHLGAWVANQRSAKRGTGSASLDQQQMDLLDKLGFVWEPHCYSGSKVFSIWKPTKQNTATHSCQTATSLLMASTLWEQSFQHLEAYEAEIGNTLVPSSHVAADGFNLGAWVANQRSAKRGTGSGSLDQRQMDLLDKLGFVWEPASVQWEQSFQRVQAYTAEHGNTLVPSSHVTADGFHLGAWVSKQRSAKRGVGSGSLDPRQKDMLDKLGFVWEPASFWEQSFQRLQAYKAEHGSTLVPRNHVAADGFHLGAWVANQRSATRRTGSASLDQQQVDLLDKLGFVWEPASVQWEQGFQHLEAYEAEHGNTLVPYSHVAADGFNLGSWISKQRSAKRGVGSASLDQRQMDLLDQLGFDWEPVSLQWERRFQQLQVYTAEHGDTFVPSSHVCADGFHLGTWVSKQRSAKGGVGSGSLDQRQKDMLDKLGFVWESAAFQWGRSYQLLQLYKAKHGNTLVPSSHVAADGFHLGAWVANQRSAKRRGTGTGSLDQQQMDMLDKLGFVWERVSFQWEQRFQRLQAYKAEHSNTLVPQNFVTADGFRLGTWITTQRSAKR